jgi:hypothetical protein
MAIVGNKAGGRMGYVCDDYFDHNNNAARVACKQMGWEDGRYWDPNNKGWSWSVRYSMDNVICTGEERNLDQCSFIETHNCYASEVAGVECLGHRVMPPGPPGRSTGPAALHTLYRGHGWCLDYHQGNANVYLHTCHGGGNQQWYINEHNELKTQANGLCLDYHTGNDNAYMHHCHGGNNQKWYMDDLGQIKTLHDHWCLDYDTSLLQVAAEVQEKPAAELLATEPAAHSQPSLDATDPKKKVRALLEKVRHKQEEVRHPQEDESRQTAGEQPNAEKPSKDASKKSAKSYALQARLQRVSKGMASGSLEGTMAKKWVEPRRRRRRSHNVYLHDCHGGTNQQWQFR